MSNTIKEFSQTIENYINLLVQKDFKVVLDAQDIDITVYNALIVAHIAAVLAQSQGVGSLKITWGFMLPNPLSPLDDIKNIPYAICNFKVNLKNGLSISNDFYAGRATVQHENFNFYNSASVHSWIKDQIKSLKSPKNTSHPFPLNPTVIIIDRNSKHNRIENATIYQHVVEQHLTIKSFLNFYFLNQNLANSLEKVKSKKI